MKYQSVKKQSEIQLEGVTVEIEKVDNSTRAVIITDAKGQQLRIAYASYCMEVLVPAAPEMEKVYIVKGKVGEVNVPEETFTDSYEAEQRKAAILRSVDYRGEVEIEEGERPVAA